MKPGAMPRHPVSTGRSPANLAFSALLFSFLGWAILERWSLGAGTGASAHLIIALACAPVMACSLHRFRTLCPRHMRPSLRPRPGMRAAGLALALLFGVGALFGMAAASGSLVFLLLPCALCCATPWTRFGVHRQHLFVSLLALTAGSALAPGLAGQQPDKLAAMLAAWWLWGAASLLCIALCGGELLKRKGGR